ARLHRDHRLTSTPTAELKLQPRDAITRHRQRHWIHKAPRTIADPHPIERLTRIHRDDHRRRIKRNPQHRHKQPPPNRTPIENPPRDYSWPISYPAADQKGTSTKPFVVL